MNCRFAKGVLTSHCSDQLCIILQAYYFDEKHTYIYSFPLHKLFVVVLFPPPFEVLVLNLTPYFDPLNSWSLFHWDSMNKTTRWNGYREFRYSVKNRVFSVLLT